MSTWRDLEETLSRVVSRIYEPRLTILFHKLMTIQDGLTKLFAEVKEKDRIDDLSLEYKKFAEWLRIE